MYLISSLFFTLINSFAYSFCPVLFMSFSSHLNILLEFSKSTFYYFKSRISNSNTSDWCYRCNKTNPWNTECNKTNLDSLLSFQSLSLSSLSSLPSLSVVPSLLALLPSVRCHFYSCFLPFRFLVFIFFLVINSERKKNIIHSFHYIKNRFNRNRIKR